MKYLVIGCNSFSGSHFVDKILEKKHKVIGISRSKKLPNYFLKFSSNKNLNKLAFTYRSTT